MDKLSVVPIKIQHHLRWRQIGCRVLTVSPSPLVSTRGLIDSNNRGQRTHLIQTRLQGCSSDVLYATVSRDLASSVRAMFHRFYMYLRFLAIMLAVSTALGSDYQVHGHGKCKVTYRSKWARQASGDHSHFELRAQESTALLRWTIGFNRW
ncbi:uncharacterized protein EDB91DRAFT_831987 [Suillus paluster]|uniref:uncharacterized protein n=1 Tax=Suillus paluster TaxID=48578 RepID=UPI001B87F029|nr:uncharacterized protein EDB91DRAFT_831987 [Suillus paluster]KAG1749059.1 hypothetical protein EDB91DRAFT_831987 [Suillus paluster]